MSKIKLLSILACTFLFVFASTPEFLKAPMTIKPSEINGSPDFNSWIMQSTLSPIEEPPISNLAITWQAKAIVPADRYRPAGCCDTSGHFYVIGGWTNSTASNVVFKYFTDSDSWCQVANLPYAVTNHSAIFHAPTNRIYVFCGYDGSNALNYVQIYDIARDSWYLGTPATQAMLGTYGAAIGDSIFITGSDLNSTNLGLWCYRVSTNTWSYIGALPGASASGGAASYHNKVYFSGGWPSRDTVTVYEIGVGASVFVHMPRGQHGHGTEVVNGKLWVFGGGQSWGVATANVYSYDLDQGPGGNWLTEDPMISTRYAGAYGKILYQDTWRLHAATGLTGVSSRFNLHEQGTIPSPPPIDAKLLKINQPSRSPIPNSSISPNVTIMNNGTHPISNIPATIWIDSRGTRIYNQSQTYTETLNPNDTANITFSPNFNIGGPGASYGITAFTDLPGDSDRTNDTLKQVTYLRGLTWTDLPTIPASSSRQGGCGDTMGHFYIYGGYTTTYSDDLYRYDETSNAWTQLADMQVGVMNITGTYDLARNRIYVPGGYSPYRNFLQIYYVDEDSWGMGSPMPIATSGAPCAVVGDSLYVVLSSPNSGALMIYNINTNSWTFGQARPNCQSYSGLVAYNRKLYSVGGWSNDATVYEYDIDNDTWTRLPNLPVGGSSPVVAVINDKILVLVTLSSWPYDYNYCYILDPYMPSAGWLSENTPLRVSTGSASGSVTTHGITRVHIYSGYHEAGSYPFLAHDVSATTIIEPSDTLPQGFVTTPEVIIRNYGMNSETFPVVMKIGTVYCETLPNVILNVAQTDTIEFPDWTTIPGSYTITAFTNLAGDMDRTNDTTYSSVEVIVYDYYEDFEANNGGYIPEPDSGWKWLQGNSHSGIKAWGTGPYLENANWKLTSIDFQAVRDTPQLRFWHWYEMESYWDGGNVKLSTDGGNTWNIISPHSGYDLIADSSNAGIPGESCYSGLYRTWQEAVFDLPVSSGQLFKIRWHFGSDQAGNFSGWYIDDVAGAGFNPVGIAQEFKPQNLLKPFFIALPNPISNKGAKINFGVTKTSKVSLLIYDISGSLIRTLAAAQFEPGEYTLIWNGMDDKGKKCPTGIYFYKFESDEYKTTKKAVKLN